MSKEHWIQRDFSGGEISPKMLMRQDTEVYQKSAGVMKNFFPTPTGSAVRVPGTRFIRELAVGGQSAVARIMPYLTLANERSLIVMEDAKIKLIRNITDNLDPDNGGIISVTPQPPVEEETTSLVLYERQITPNFTFRRGIEDWKTDAPEYTDRGDGPLGVWLSDSLNNTMTMSARIYTNSAVEKSSITLELEKPATVPDTVTGNDKLTIDFKIAYTEHVGGPGGFLLNVVISTNEDYSSPVYDEQWTEVDYPVAGGFITAGVGSDPFDIKDLPADYSGPLYAKINLQARTTSDRPDSSHPVMNVYYFKMWAQDETEITEADLVSPYTSTDLPDVHYIQSPYDAKEMVFTHWRHPPQRFFFDAQAGKYKMEDIPFKTTTPEGVEDYTPVAWGDDNYPATCGSYHGRLVLAGAQTFKTVLANPIATSAETVWCTEVSRWNFFSTDFEDINPDDSIEFTAVYRSPIQWVYGQKTLLVGALEYEYSASGEGIFAPGDLGVFLHSTHGSLNVQPAGFGESVLFPSDGGLRVRSMRYKAQDEGWISADISLLNPEITSHGIVRMARVRAPHQMCWCLTGNGNIAVWSQESGLQGWSRLTQNAGHVKDLCVMADEQGRDVPFVTVNRFIDGRNRLYLEAYTDLRSEAESLYLECSVIKRPLGDTITGLEHLEGQTVSVSDPYRYVGFFVVSGGQVVLDDQAGGTTTMEVAYVGLQNRCMLRTLPPQKADPGAQARFSSFSVRCLGSVRPIINGERTPDRDTKDSLNLSNGLDLLNDVEVRTRGWNPYQPITIWEQVPFRVEILGVHGSLKTGDL